MATKTWFGIKAKGRDSYLALVRQFPLASIQFDEHLTEEQKVMDRLLAKGRLDGGAAMYLDALSDLVAAYEDEHHAIAAASDADMLRLLLEAKDVPGATESRHVDSQVHDLRGLGGQEAFQPADDAQARRILHGGREHTGGEHLSRPLARLGRDEVRVVHFRSLPPTTRWSMGTAES